MNSRETGEADKAIRQDAGTVGETGTKEERGVGGSESRRESNGEMVYT